MKRLSYVAATLMTVWMLQSCGGGNTESKHEDAVDSAQAVNKETAPVDQSSSDFAVKAADAGMKEIALGKIAQEKGVNPQVKAFGEQMVADHSKAADELKSIAAAKNITLPDSVGVDYKKDIDDISKKTGKDFDKAYVNEMVKDHNDAVDLFRKASDDVTDPELKAFAAKTLPTLEAHQTHVKTLDSLLKKNK
ncbi:DUF4142 domain-containing protein [Chitinophaga sancti]|uniref:DUF4142 domain-containing protein n=1 Tax=Chitinophaga sancti TaxID=1004 RepID=A0A1K1MHD5_9BACT|nr:DUF4142 domain-containing protein [Chitinophaga sancti]WQD62692.1 DUF4142 domain-containing protein [Chitinophaga sancti]WQG91684.1 DUF4142 domain-containing protein [Chitinophaga sancti]SFW22572.1 putative membrane protein [Chitinophaga sancti]